MKKRIISIMLAVIVTVTSMGSNVSASELGESADELIQTQTEKTEIADADEELEKPEDDVTTEHTTTEAASEKQEAESDEEVSKEQETDHAAEEEGQENADDSAMTEDADAESETAEAETTIEASEEDETEIEASEAENALVASATDIASGQYTENGSNVTWVIDVNGKLTVEGTGEFSNHNAFMESAPWNPNADSIQSAEIKVTGMTNASYMFYNCTNLTSIDLSGFDTSNVTDMAGMFWGCENLSSIDVSGFNTGKVTLMSSMFCLCKSLTSLDVSGFNTGNVKDMSSMFLGCENLASINVSGFDTSNVGGNIYFAGGAVSMGSMSSMFSGCKSLTSVDVSNFDTRKVSNMSQMFKNCSSLTSMDVSNFDTSESIGMDRMFEGCCSLVSVDISGFKTKEKAAGNMFNMFEGCSSLTSVNLKDVDTRNVFAMQEMFSGCKSLTSLDLSSFDTSKIASTDRMFYGCSGLTNLELGNFNTSNVTNMSHMFYDCSGLTNLDVTNFNTGNVTDMNSMFYGCSGLTSLDISNFNTGNVTDMDSMFYGCSGLTSLDVSNFNTGNVIKMNCMFYRCSSLTGLDLSSFDTSNVLTMGGSSIYYGEGMFEGCSSLTSLNLSSFDTSKVTSMMHMFRNCKSLTTLDLSNFDTSNVTDMSYLFEGCSNLTTLDISGFNTSNAGPSHEYEMTCMFNDCENLTIIYTPYSLPQSVFLPRKEVENVYLDTWYDCEGTPITKLPQNLGYSMAIMKNQVPYTSTLIATKTKTAYECGDILNIDDLAVYYYNDKGKPTEVTESYSTNANEIDMSTVGKKTLRITYNDMTADVDIIVGNIYTVTFVGTGKDDIAEGTVDWLEAGTDYTFTLQKETGSIYTVSAMMGEKDVTPTPDKTGNIYTISGVNDNLVITIEKTAESGLSIRFVNENDKKIPYTGTAIQPQISVTYNGKKLISGTDYTVKYSNNIKVGTAAKITVTGKGNFAGGNSTTTFEIVPRNIADVTLCGVTAEADGKETLTLANGSTLTPILYYNNIKLTNKDYVIKDVSDREIAGKKLSDSDNTTTIKIEGKSGRNFTGSREVKLNVVDKKNLIKFTVAVNKDKLNALTYDGSPHYIHEFSGAITVTAKNAAKTNMEYGTDYTIVYPSDVTNAGTKKFTVVGCGLYTGSVSQSYAIKPAKEATLSVKYDGSIVSGNKITTPFPFASSGITFGSKLTVTDGNGNALSEGKDYKVSYSGNKQVGTGAKCTITFLGNYKGYAKQTVGFEITKADLSDAEVIIADKAYTGKAGIYKSVPYVIEDKDDANVLLKSSNYKTTYYIENPTNNDNAAQMKGKNKVEAGGTVWVKLEAKGNNYSGTQIVSYKVREVAHDLSKAKITFKDADGNIVNKMPYTGNKITDKHIKAVVDGVLAENIDGIEVIYVNNINKGKATIIIKGTNTDTCAYANCKTATFSIEARSFSLN